jgi:hypothetical protein
MPLFKVSNFNQIDVSFVQTAKVVKVEYKNTARFFRTLSIDALLNYYSIELSFNIEPPYYGFGRILK